MMRLICVAGARPNFMKIAPLMRAFAAEPSIEAILVHTGQHYDEKMSDLFFRQLEIPEPDINLGCGGGSHTEQTAAIMLAFEKVLLEKKPDAVLVVGDVNSTIACGIVTVKMGIRLMHVEAGLRSFDRSMPEEINRILTDSISDLLFVSEPAGVENLRAEGIDSAKIHFVGNVMIDTLLANREKAGESDILERLGIARREYAALTLHRPSNVDNPEIFGEIIDALAVIGREMKIVFPIHPRTKKNLAGMGLLSRASAIENLLFVEPLGYLEFLCLMNNARLVMTDSGGIQEETTILGVPCMTLRENTERPVTVTHGTNRLVSLRADAIAAQYRDIMRNGNGAAHGVPELWDGNAAERIARVIVEQCR